MDENKELTTRGTTELETNNSNKFLGLENAKTEDIVIPRIKVINALSPERVDGIAEEGAVLNTLTQEPIGDRVFIPIKQYYTNIEWNPDRGAEQRMLCRSFDGRTGNCDDGIRMCDACGGTRFDNTKTGKAAQPTCTAYINFLGFFAGEPMPVVLSFAKTNYNEGKKLLSIAKSMRCSIWNYGYKIGSKQMTKDRNKWFNLTIAMAGPTSEEDRALAFELYKVYDSLAVNTDYEEQTGYTQETSADVEAEI